jgi:hypothetical protein
MKFPADVKVTIQADDNLSKPPKTKILLDDQEIADGYLVTREDFHKIVATVTDDGGLTNQDGPFDFVLDKTKPVVKVTVLVDGVAEPLESGDQFNHAITPEITIEDLTATSFTATLARGTGEPQKYDKGTEIAEDGKYTLVITVRDDLNNTTPLDPITFTVDKTPPVVLVKEADVTFEGGKFDRNVTPVVLIQDLTETTVTATLDDVIWTPGTEIAAEGDHVLKITVTDELLWSTVVPPISFTVDKSAPVVVITERGDVLNDGALFNRDAQPKIVVTDTTGTTLTATLDDAQFTSEQLVTTERRHVLKVSATDALHHTTDVPPIAFTVDKTRPVHQRHGRRAAARGASAYPRVTSRRTSPSSTSHRSSRPRFTLDGQTSRLGTRRSPRKRRARPLDLREGPPPCWDRYVGRSRTSRSTTTRPSSRSKSGTRPLASGDEFGAIDQRRRSTSPTSVRWSSTTLHPRRCSVREGHSRSAKGSTRSSPRPSRTPPAGDATADRSRSQSSISRRRSSPCSSATSYSSAGTKFNRPTSSRRSSSTDLTKTTTTDRDEEGG